MVAGGVATALAVCLQLGGKIFTVFNKDLSTTAATALAITGPLLFALFVLAIANRIKLNRMEDADS